VHLREKHTRKGQRTGFPWGNTTSILADMCRGRLISSFAPFARRHCPRPHHINEFPWMRANLEVSPHTQTHAHKSTSTSTRLHAHKCVFTARAHTGVTLCLIRSRCYLLSSSVAAICRSPFLTIPADAHSACPSQQIFHVPPNASL